MKTLRLSAILLLLGTLTLGMAEVSVDDQISAIVNAAPEERVALVNDFKETLSTMSEEDRAIAIAQMRENMAGTGEQTQTRTQTRQRSQLHQMQQSEGMQQAQQMNQKQSGSQAMQQGKLGTGSGVPNSFMGNK